MAADTDICNLALGFLGDVANVISINPPEPSAQAEYCAKFYPIARDQLLNMHNWGFATRRTLPGSIAVPTEAGAWQFAYIAPADCLTVTRVYDPTQTSDFVTTIPQPFDQSVISPNVPNMSSTGADIGAIVPQEFVVETDANGNDIIYTNQAGAAISYTAKVTDTTKFSPSFVVALATLLASFLAGPIIKGTDGIKMAQAMMKAFQGPGGALGIATASDANERRINMASTTPWMVNR